MTLASNALLCWNNRADAATLAAGTYDATYVRNNLKDANISLFARTTDATEAKTRFRADLGAAYSLQALALVNNNFSTSALWRVRGGNAPFDVLFDREDYVDERLTCSGGANGTRVNSLGVIVAATCPRIDHSPVNLASGTVTQTLSNVPAGRYALVVVGSGSAVIASGSTLQAPAFAFHGNKGVVVVESAGNVTLTVTGSPSALHLRECYGVLDEETRENLLLNSLLNGTSLSTQTVTVTAVQHTLSFYGTGTVTLSGASTAGPLVGTSNTVRSKLTFTPSAGSLTLTVSGTVKFANLETGPGPTSFIPTAGASVTRTKDTIESTYAYEAGTIYVEARHGISAGGACGAFGFASAAADRYNGIYFGSTQSIGQVYDGVSQCDIRASSTPGAVHKLAMRFATDDFAYAADGVLVGTDTAGSPLTSATKFVIGDLTGTHQYPLNEHVMRVTFWPKGTHAGMTNAQLQAITANGPDIPEVGGFASGMTAVKQMTFYGDTPSDWAAQYPAMVAFDAVTARYLTVEVIDTANADTYVQMGRLFVGSGFQCADQTEARGYEHPHEDLSTKVTSSSGKDYGTERRRRRRARFRLPNLTRAEADHLHEMRAFVGKLGEILYVSDPSGTDDANAENQRYGGLFKLPDNLFTIEQVEAEQFAATIELEEKL